MRRIVDLTRPIDPADRELLPPEVGNIFAPRVRVLTPAGDGAIRMSEAFGCPVEDLPGGEGWAEEFLDDMNTHCGTHVDAPLHSGSQCEGRPARRIDEIALDELVRPAHVLDLREPARPGQAFQPGDLDRALRAAGIRIRPGDAVLLRTGQERYTARDREYFDYPGMSREATLFLTGLGAVVLGTDGAGWDRPFWRMRNEYRQTKDAAVLWDGHRAIREREAFVVQQLHGLDQLPLTGFTFGVFPLRLVGLSAAPARAVAFLD
jgi:kynurenine formamidase